MPQLIFLLLLFRCFLLFHLLYAALWNVLQETLYAINCRRHSATGRIYMCVVLVNRSGECIDDDAFFEAILSQEIGWTFCCCLLERWHFQIEMKWKVAARIKHDAKLSAMTVHNIKSRSIVKYDDKAKIYYIISKRKAIYIMCIPVTKCNKRRWSKHRIWLA